MRKSGTQSLSDRELDDGVAVGSGVAVGVAVAVGTTGVGEGRGLISRCKSTNQGGISEVVQPVITTPHANTVTQTYRSHRNLRVSIEFFIDGLTESGRAPSGAIHTSPISSRHQGAFPV
jgi:hypothetical protein